MNAATLSRDALIPRNPDGLGRGLALALGVHGLLVIAIACGVSWRSSNPAGIEAELWAAVPQIAAPKPVEPEPTPQPVKKPEPPPPPPKAEAPKQADAQIAIEKARREEERKRKEDQQRREEELKRQKEDQQRKLAEAEKLKKELAEQKQAEQKRREAAEAAAAEKRREEQLQRLAALAGDGAPNSAGTAAKTAGPSAGYAGRVIARLRPLSVFADAVAGNPKAEVEIRVGPDGTIIGRKLLKSSGVPAWDDAVLRAIDKAEALPRDVDGRVQNPTIVIWGPKD